KKSLEETRESAHREQERLAHDIATEKAQAAEALAKLKMGMESEKSERETRHAEEMAKREAELSNLR
ncbi:unnamed protein product, partial [Amoebophrya sp. A25]